jgi:hypothetical protein
MRQIPFIAQETDFLSDGCIESRHSVEKVTDLAANDVPIDKRSEFGKT